MQRHILAVFDKRKDIAGGEFHILAVGRVRYIKCYRRDQLICPSFIFPVHIEVQSGYMAVQPCDFHIGLICTGDKITAVLPQFHIFAGFQLCDRKRVLKHGHIKFVIKQCQLQYKSQKQEYACRRGDVFQAGQPGPPVFPLSV